MIEFTPRQIKVMKVLGDCPREHEGIGRYTGYTLSHLADLVSGKLHNPTAYSRHASG